MKVYPRNVPRLRDELIDLWATYGKVMVARGDTSPEGEMKALHRAELIWVATDMCKLWNAAEQSLPTSTVLRPEDLPSDFGFIVLEDPLWSLDAVRLDEERMKVRAFSWAIARVQGDLAVHLSFYMDTEAWEDLARQDSGYASKMVYIGNSDWFFETAVDDFTNKAYENEELWPGGGGPPKKARDSIIEDRRRLAALVMLLHQPIVVDSVAPVTRQERRAFERKKQEVPQVRVLTLRETHKSQDKSDEPQSVDWSHRWLVSGHWRNQWYASEQRHRPIWIAPFVKGPEDKPLLVRETVRAWRR